MEQGRLCEEVLREVGGRWAGPEEGRRSTLGQVAWQVGRVVVGGCRLFVIFCDNRLKIVIANRGAICILVNEFKFVKKKTQSFFVSKRIV